MTDRVTVELLYTSIQDSLAVLREYEVLPGNGSAIEPFESLIAQCETILARTPHVPVLRTIHHFACSGGTLISRLVSAMPNTRLLSEVDPLSDMMLPRLAPDFRPTDLIYGMRVALRPADSEQVLRVFIAGLRELFTICNETGEYLVLRDHAHSQFCTRTDYHARPTLREIVVRDFPVRSIVTVRHPLDSYLALLANKWDTFANPSLNEYARRYKTFLDRHRDMPVLRYEDFLDDPVRRLEELCGALELPYIQGSEDLLSIIRLSGDSGRSALQIAARPRRPVTEEVKQQCAVDGPYQALCRTLGYDPIA